jgi:S1-C subfamily serine protease
MILLAGCASADRAATTTTGSPTAAAPAATAAASPSAAASASPAAATAASPTAAAAASPSAAAAAAPTTSSSPAATAGATSTPAAAAAAAPPAAGDPRVLPLTRGLVGQVAAKAKPGVVQITNERYVLQARGGPGQVVPAGAGTGFVIDGQGHILTNNHVVEDAQALEIETADGKTFTAKLIGRDPRTDLAVIQVEGANLPAVPLGDSSKLQVGDGVVAIGNALALEGGPTVTTGVVSALGRTVTEPGGQNAGPGGAAGPRQGYALFDAIQTDAAINPGNSGGPLLDLDGNVIGINTLGVVQAEPGVPAQGVNFAIAINTAKRIADELIRTGKVEYAFFGVSAIPNTPALARRYGLPAKPGMAIADVQAGSPAAKAGIQPKDVITAVDGQPLKDESDLQRITAQHKPGDSVKATIARGDQTQDVTVTLGAAPSAAA